MKRKNYVPTTLGQFLNENRNITLARKYGDREPVVVGSKAPLRNQVLAFVMENESVTRNELKRFIAGLNETSKNPAAAATMWLKRNEKFFVTESKGTVTTYKLSKIGQKLAEMFKPIEEEISESMGAAPGVDKGEELEEACSMKEGEDEEDEEEVNETREERVAKIVERIKAKRAQSEEINENDDPDLPELSELNEGEEAMNEEDDDEEEEIPAEEEGDEDESEEDESEEDESEEDEEAPVEDVPEEPKVEDDDKTEITEFVITVDDVEEAIAELGELGVEAKVAGSEGGEELPSLDDEGGEELPDLEGEEGDELAVDDFDLDLGGEIDGEEPEVEESTVTGMKNPEQYKASGLLEDDDEFTMDDLESFDDEPAEVEGEEEDLVPASKGEGEDLEGGEDELGDLEGGEEELPVEGGETQIKVKAEHWPQLKGWLEGKGVDIEDMFGGEIEMEGEEVEDEISFDGLEDVEGEEKKEAPVEDEEESEEEVPAEEGEEEEDKE
jgi:hypothetical protein